MERQSGQRILNTAAGVGIAILLGSGMALAASGVFTTSDYRATPPTSSPIPDAGAGPGMRPPGQGGRDSASPAPPTEAPASPLPPAGPPQEPVRRIAPPPVRDALVPGERPDSEQPDSGQAGDDRADDGSVEGGGEPDGGKARHEARGDKGPGVGPGTEGSGNRHREPRNHRHRCE